MTFSITARCPDTGMLGVAISTKRLCVGARCPFARANVGAIATQSFVNPYIGIHGLEYLVAGMDAASARDRLVAEDERHALRQFAIVDREGRAEAYSGHECIGWFGHQTGDGYVVAGNMLVGEQTIAAMARSFEVSRDLTLPERLVRAIEAGQAAGGDKRGRQSAALKVAHIEEYPLVDIRVDDQSDPVAELHRLWNLYQEELGPIMPMLPSKDYPAGHLTPNKMRKYLPADA
jgi:uncharacterized Ntn-hydrolase superfamily protein